MSSGPVGLDVREWVYGSFFLVLAGAGNFIVSARKNWRVTKVQFFTAAAAGHLTLTANNRIPVAANACMVLEPNGAHNGPLTVQGDGAFLIVEYWFQCVDTPNAPQIAIDVNP
jgi:hypothetical protein